MRQIIFLLILFSILGKNSIKAEEPIKVQIAPPNIASFNKFIDNPVNIYNGTPDVSLNLYTLKDGAIEIPITLRYNTSGIKVGEEASWVGLSWNLNVGGHIYQNVVGFSDRHLDRYAYKQLMIQPALSHFISQPTKDGFAYLEYNQNVNDLIAPYFSEPQPAVWGPIEPDIFYFSYPGNAGKFIIDYWTNNIYILSREEGITIEMDGYYEGFTIKTLDGIKHVFKSTIINYGFNDPISYTYALEESIYPNRQRVFYEYSTSKYGKYSLSEILTFVGEYKPPIAFPVDTDLPNFRNNATYNMRTNFYECSDLILKKIKTDNYEVVFSADSTKAKLPNNSYSKNYKYTLNNIEIKSLINDKKKAFSFIYDSFLKEIYEESSPNKMLLYSFSYDGNAPSASTGKDYWGYANGLGSSFDGTNPTGFLVNTSTELPDLSLLYAFNPSFSSIRSSYQYSTARSNGIIKKSDRRSNFDEMRKGMLKRINYSTGGYLEFEYESNTFNNIGAKNWVAGSEKIPIADIAVTQDVHYYINNSKDKVKTAEVETIGYAHANHSYRPYGSYKPESESYTIDKDKTLSQLSITVDRGSVPGEYIICPDGFSSTGTPACNSYFFVEVNLLKKDSKGVFTLHHQHRFRNSMSHDKTIRESETLNLTKGEYKLVVKFPNINERYQYENIKDGINENWGEVNATLSWDKTNSDIPITNTIPEFSSGCGLRIKSIKQYNEIGDKEPLLQTDYEYSDGMLHDIIDFCSKTWVLEYYYNDYRSNYATTRYLYKLSNNNMVSNPYGTSSGVGYSFVKEIRKGKNNIGYTIYNYHNSPGTYKFNVGGVKVDVPMNGKLKEQLTYNSQNILIRKNSYTYSANKTNEYWGINMLDAMVGQVKEGSLSNSFHFVYFSYKWKELPTTMIDAESYGDRYRIYKYVINSHDLTLASKETAIDGVKVKEEFTYDPNTLQVRTHKMTENSSNVREIKYSYPSDFSSIAPYKSMINKNMLSYLVEQKIFRNGKQLENKKINYKSWDILPTGIKPPTMAPDLIEGFTRIKPSSIETSSGGNLQTEITYDLYDLKGNLLQLTTKEGIAKTYLWSYGGQYPVAEIVNASYEDVKTALDGTTPESISASDFPDISKINALREKLPNAQITTYTYKPLVGMLTSTDPRGVTTHYDYDDFGRLKEVYIKETPTSPKRVIESYDYKYANQ